MPKCIPKSKPEIPEKIKYQKKHQQQKKTNYNAKKKQQ